MVKKIGLVISSLDNIARAVVVNGILQNILFFYNYLKYMTDANVFFILRTCNNSTYDFILYHELDKIRTLDYAIVVGARLPAPLLDFCKTYNIKTILYRFGNDLVYDTTQMLFDRSTNKISIKNDHLYDENWISPHFEYGSCYYKYIHKTDKSIVVPYFWQPDFIEHLSYTNTNLNEINIGVFESNSNFSKSSFIPIIICENSKEYINKAYIFNSSRIYKKTRIFKEFINKSVLFEENRLSLEQRHDFKKVINNRCNVVISFVENCDLNYLYLECFYLGIPLIHNSKMLKDYGFYYEGYNVDQAVNHIKTLKKSFNKQNYIEKHKSILKKYSLENPESIKFFNKLLGINTKISTNKNKGFIPSNFENERQKNWVVNNLAKPWITNLNLSVDGYIWSADIEREKLIPIKYNTVCNKKFTSIVFSLDNEKKKRMKKNLDNECIFIDLIPFKLNITKNEKHKIIGNSHIKGWKYALKKNLDGALFFEDDIILLKNWKSILGTFIEKVSPDIVRMDSLPYRIGNNDDEVIFYKDISPWCLGGYYLSKKAIVYLVSYFDSYEWSSTNCEVAFSQAFQKFYNSLYTSFPRLCIQNWYEQESSRVQENDHLKRLADVQIKTYLPKYGKLYNIEYPFIKKIPESIKEI